MPSTATDMLDGLSTSVAVKAPCVTVATTNITLSGLQTISTVTVTEGDRVLVTGQTDQTTNGIYDASTGSWTRSKDFDGNRDVVRGTLVLVAGTGTNVDLYEVTSDDPITIDTSNITFASRFGTNTSIDRSAAEITLGVVPAVDGYPVGNILRYGAIGTGLTGDAATNSTAIQTAIDVVQEQGGGVVAIPPGTYCTGAVLILPKRVSLIGEGRESSKLKKVTAAASTVTDATVPIYQVPTAVGFPIAVVHAWDGAVAAQGYSFGVVRGIGFYGDTDNPNTSAVHYGFFANGMSGCVVEECHAENVQVGFFYGEVSSIYSAIRNNTYHKVWRGCYQHFATSTNYTNNIATRYRYNGHFLSHYYSQISGNAADTGGHTDVRVADTELCIGYHLYDCNGMDFVSNGCEVHNGTPLKVEGCASVDIDKFTALEIFSDHDGTVSGLNVYALDMDLNTDMGFSKCRFVFRSTAKLSGDALPADHANYRVTNQTGFLDRERVRFIDTLNSTTEFGWSGSTSGSTYLASSGTFHERQESGSFPVTMSGLTTVVTSTALYERHDNSGTIYVPEMSGTSNSSQATLTSTGYPASMIPARPQRDFIPIRDNGTVALGTCVLSTAGVFTLAIGSSEGNFSSTGTKSVFHKTMSVLLT